jgi:hypothetical protein
MSTDNKQKSDEQFAAADGASRNESNHGLNDQSQRTWQAPKLYVYDSKSHIAASFDGLDDGIGYS